MLQDHPKLCEVGFYRGHWTWFWNTPRVGPSLQNLRNIFPSIFEISKIGGHFFHRATGNGKLVFVSITTSAGGLASPGCGYPFRSSYTPLQYCQRGHPTIFPVGKVVVPTRTVPMGANSTLFPPYFPENKGGGG